MRIVVAGAGVAGLGASLALARAGHDVTLLDRDGPVDEGPWNDSPNETRVGCPQLNQAHNFLSRAFNVLDEHAPDALERMRARGGTITDMNLVLPPAHHSTELRGMCLRRPLIDSTLMELVREASVTFRTGAVAALRAGASHNGLPSVGGVELDDGTALDADLVIDATGRRSPLGRWLTGIGAAAPREERTPCGCVYYTRYYRIHDGVQEPPRFSPLAARGDTGFLGFSAVWEEERMFAALLAAPTEDREFRSLRSGDAFQAAAGALPALAAITDPDFSEPVSDVLPLGGLQNSIRRFDGTPALGVLPIGDSLSHTDPQQAFGMSMALHHAFRLPGLLDAHGVEGLFDAFIAAVGREADDRFRMCSEFDRQRSEIWAGRAPDIDKDDDYLLFLTIGALGRNDFELFLRLVRRALAVDLPSDFTDDTEAVHRARASLRESGLAERRGGPTREELLALIGATV